MSRHPGWKAPITAPVELECDGDGTYWVCINGKRLFGRDPNVVPLGSGDLAHLGLHSWDGEWPGIGELTMLGGG